MVNHPKRRCVYQAGSVTRVRRDYLFSNARLKKVWENRIANRIPKDTYRDANTHEEDANVSS
jgi:hypothetical protein